MHFFLLSQMMSCIVLLSRVITEPNFNSIPDAEIKTHGGTPLLFEPFMLNAQSA